jgi:hypothetical protein
MTRERDVRGHNAPVGVIDAILDLINEAFVLSRWSPFGNRRKRKRAQTMRLPPARRRKRRWL